MDESARAQARGAAAPKVALLRAQELDKSFFDAGREISVLRRLNLDVTPGEQVAIVGQSGVGKSTLLHVLGSLDRPSGGKVYFEGQDIFALDEAGLSEYRNHCLGFVFQFHYLLPDFSALENVMMPCLIARMSRRQGEVRAAEVLELVGLGDKLERRPGELSGGEQQRVAVARALVLKPKLVLADEPTGNLDPKTAEEVHQLLAKLNRELGVTMIIATHNEALRRRVTRTLRLSEGKLAEEQGD